MACILFQASRDSRVLGFYSLRDDALHHCEDALGRTTGYGAATPFFWRERPDGLHELFAWTSGEVSSSTGFTVASVEVLAEFDEGWGADADEITQRITPTQVLREGEPTDMPCSKCGDPVHWVESTNSSGGFWRHRVVPGRVLDHFGEVAGSEWHRPTSDTAHAEDVTPQVTKLRSLLAGQRAAAEDPHDSPLHHAYRVGRDLPMDTYTLADWSAMVCMATSGYASFSVFWFLFVDAKASDFDPRPRLRTAVETGALAPLWQVAVHTGHDLNRARHSSRNAALDAAALVLLLTTRPKGAMAA
jgi:hypothetical protein